MNHPNVRAAMEDESELETVPDTGEKAIRDRIIHVLTIFPLISPAMLQVGIGTSLPPTVWRPVFTRMKNEGVVVESAIQSHAPSGRYNSYTRLSLASTQE